MHTNTHRKLGITDVRSVSSASDGLGIPLAWIYSIMPLTCYRPWCPRRDERICSWIRLMCLHDKPRKCLVGSVGASIHQHYKNNSIWEKRRSWGSYWLWAVFQLLAAELGLWLPLVHTPLPSDGSPQSLSSGSPRPAAWLSPREESTKKTLLTHVVAAIPDFHEQHYLEENNVTENQTTV